MKATLKFAGVAPFAVPELPPSPDVEPLDPPELVVPELAPELPMSPLLPPVVVEPLELVLAPGSTAPSSPLQADTVQTPAISTAPTSQ